MEYRKRDADTQLGRKDTLDAKTPELKVGHTLAGGAGMGMVMGNGRPRRSRTVAPRPKGS